MTAADIATTIDTYRQAAANALRAGFDGLEIHAQASHLVAQFLNPRLNQRTDAYGGPSRDTAERDSSVPLGGDRGLRAVTSVRSAGDTGVERRGWSVRPEFCGVVVSAGDRPGTVPREK
ncbi:hypothetical protein M271_50905 [Streptomyces rapamycinicus NRRL 5491]|uniref:N-ethylmaleimide reductase n=1 Tax=Streptomyces rapamycinicus TaxID=1226757 RepID=A0ABR6LY78_9ACTN|nr:hypothetical protein M271_50905 [Streptomyces rapamycinicus NRRL 5491]MBB4787260.1 N-ethylmaleimide reductase [Streptomyces rapamycinicus]